jgi:hypothetical protein
MEDHIGGTGVFHLIVENNVRTDVTAVTYGMHFISSVACYYEHGNDHFGRVKRVVIDHKHLKRKIWSIAKRGNGVSEYSDARLKF